MPDTEKNNSYVQDLDLYNKKINSIPAKKQEIGIDTDDSLARDMIEMESTSNINIGQLEAFTTVSQSRDQLYTMLDNMASDPMVAASLEIYAEDSTEANDDGRIVWADSSDENVRKYVQFLLDTLNVDKNIYKWTYSLCKYGDIYLRLFRESEIKDKLFDDENTNKTLNEELEKDLDKESKLLEENVNLKLYSKNDKYIHYIEMVPNPAEVFELTKFGKSYAYIQAPLGYSSYSSTPGNTQTGTLNTFNYYRFKKKDVNLYSATEFVHGALEDNFSRSPEQVQIFLTDSDFDSDDGNAALTYSVRRGQSVLYPAFKAWRNKSLLENSVLLNRLTKSSIIRVVSVEVGDMPKEQVQPHLYNVKSLIEQKSAISQGNSLEEYTNPGPVENIIYIPTRGGQGNLSVQQIGDDVDVKSLADVEYFKDTFYGCLSGDTNIRLVDGSEYTVEYMANNEDKFIGKQIYSCDINGNEFISNITGAFKTKDSSDFIEFELDDGSIIKVTPEHQMMLEDGTFKMACELTEDDILMSI